jgi:putative ATP-binding cassette transporter
MIGGLSNTAILYLVNQTIPNRAMEIPWDLVSCFIAVFFIYLITQHHTQKKLIIWAEGSLETMRVDLAKKISKCRFAWMEEFGSEKFIAHLTKDMTVLSSVWPLLITVATSVVTVSTAFIYLAYLSFSCFLITVATTMAGVGIYMLLSRNANNKLIDARKTENHFIRHIQHLIGGAKELKINRKRSDDFFFNDFLPNCALCFENNSQAKIKLMESGLAGNSIFYLLFGSVAFFSHSYFAVTDENVTSYLVLLLFVMGPLIRIISSLSMIHVAKVSANQLKQVHRLLSPNLEPPGTLNPVVPLGQGNWNKITLNRVQYEYADQNQAGRFRIHDLDLTIFRGEILFIIGGNGSGKSTLGKLITGIYAPGSGRIQVDDTLITDSNLMQFRQMFAAIYTDYHLFDKPYGIEVSQLNRNSRSILTRLKLPENLISENGFSTTRKLSEGQKKRLALAVAYLEDRHIYFFDEWAANQDPEFRKVFYTQLLPAMKDSGKTVIVITHDDKYMYIADRTIKMEYGTIDCEIGAQSGKGAA